MKRQPRRYHDERYLRLWLRFRGWQHWAVWRVVQWLILVFVVLTLVSMCYAYR